jgi:hypothetical protein
MLGGELAVLQAPVFDGRGYPGNIRHAPYVQAATVSVLPLRRFRKVPSIGVPTGEDMPLLHVVIVLVVVGILLWLVNAYIPMDAKIKKILNIVVVIAVIIWLLQAFGLLGAIGSVRI